MPIIKGRPNRVGTMRDICRLQEPNRDARVLNARFIGDAVDHVLNQLIQTMLVNNRELVAWRPAHCERSPDPNAHDVLPGRRSRPASIDGDDAMAFD